MRIVPVALLLVAFSAGCASLGPKTIPRDRAEYVQGLRDSWKRQLLLNMVGLRYGEAPVFLEVASVINQYSLEGQVSAGVGWSTGVGGDAQSIGAAGRFADRPTITYTPVTGERFVRSMLTPIPPVSLVAMVQAGWPVDFVFRLAVRSMNELGNSSGARLMGSAGDPDFSDTLTCMTLAVCAGGHVESIALMQFLNGEVYSFPDGIPAGFFG